MRAGHHYPARRSQSDQLCHRRRRRRDPLLQRRRERLRSLRQRHPGMWCECEPRGHLSVACVCGEHVQGVRAVYGGWGDCEGE